MEGKSRVLVVLAICVLILCAISAMAGDVYYVDADRPDDSGNGLTWATAEKTINAALGDASNDDQIWVAAGTSYSISTSIPDGVSIYGGFAGTETSLDERNWVTNLTVISSGAVSATTTSYDITIDGFKFTGLSGISLTGDVTFSHNVVIDCDNIDPVISCVGAVMLCNNLIHDNNGYAIRREPTNTITCASSNGDATIINNTMNGNGYWGSDDAGAAIYCTGTPTIANNIFTSQAGYFIYASSVTPVVSNNCRGSNAFGGYGGFPIGWEPEDDVNADPCFVNVSADNFRLQSTSPCIDAGDDNEVGTGWVDLDGKPRQVDHISGGSIVDIGAYEYPIALGTISVPDAVGDLCLTVYYSGVTDTESSVSEVQLWYKKDNGDWTYWDSVYDSSSSGSFYFCTYGFDYGTYYFALRVLDNAGNDTGVPTSQTVPAGSTVYEYLDTHAPTLGTLSCPAYANSPFTVSYQGVEDYGSGLSSVTLWYKYGENGTWTEGPTNSSYYSSGQFTFTPSSGNGTYYFALSAEDNDGNHTAEPPTTAAGSTYFELAVTINQASTQTEDPTYTAPINFTVVFSESVSDFTAADVTLGGSAGPLGAVVTGSGTTYNVAVTGMPDSGYVTASIAAGVAHDAAGNPNVASTSTDNSVYYNADAGFIWSTKVNAYTCNSIAVDSAGGILATGSNDGNCSNSYRKKLNATNGSVTNDYGSVPDFATVASSWNPGSFCTASIAGVGINFANTVSKVGIGQDSSGFPNLDTYYAQTYAYCAVDSSGNIYAPYVAYDYPYFVVKVREFTNTNTDLQTYTDTVIANYLCYVGTVMAFYSVGGIAVDQEGGVYIAYALHNSLVEEVMAIPDSLYVAKIGTNPWANPVLIDKPQPGGYQYTRIYTSDTYDHPDTNTDSTPITVSPSGSVYIAHNFYYDKETSVSYEQDSIQAITRLDEDNQGNVTQTEVLLGGDAANSITGDRQIGYNQVNGMAVYYNGTSDELYLIGTVDYVNTLPTTIDAYHSILGNYSSAFIAKLNGSTLGVDYCSYLDGQIINSNNVSDMTFGASIAVDSSGGVYVGSSTYTANTNYLQPGGYISKVRFPSN
ncbi:Ig-like domain-containing protein [bacterium]|nr:Ig-like domain-containing protein [bacterium]